MKAPETILLAIHNPTFKILSHNNQIKDSKTREKHIQTKETRWSMVNKINKEYHLIQLDR